MPATLPRCGRSNTTRCSAGASKASALFKRPLGNPALARQDRAISNKGHQVGRLHLLARCALVVRKLNRRPRLIKQAIVHKQRALHAFRHKIKKHLRGGAAVNRATVRRQPRFEAKRHGAPAHLAGGARHHLLPGRVVASTPLLPSRPRACCTRPARARNGAAARPQAPPSYVPHPTAPREYAEPRWARAPLMLDGDANGSPCTWSIDKTKSPKSYCPRRSLYAGYPLLSILSSSRCRPLSLLIISPCTKRHRYKP